jgi:hypothetical protein
MKGDFSRFTFDPTKHYAGVMHQQGRVWLDSDWNEDVFERLSLLQRQSVDMIGLNGVPSPGAAFQISPSTDPNNLDNFQIAAGRCYVEGVLCELEKPAGYLTQPDFPDPPRIPIPTDGSTLSALIYLEVWRRLVTFLEDDSLREVALGGPDTTARLQTVAQVKVVTIPNPPPNLSCAQADQFLPREGHGTLTTLQPTTAQAKSLCQLPDPANFTGRENHFYRVQIHDSGDVAGDSSGSSFRIALSANAGAGTTTLSVAALTAPQIAVALRTGFVTVSDNTGASERVPLSQVSTTGTTLTLGRPLQNAYTTANGAAVTGGVARFKWSRDNAAFAVSVTGVSLDGLTLTVSSLGRDAATALQQGDLVEVSDDASELGPARGHLTHIATGPDPDQFTVVLADPLPASFVLIGANSPPSPTLQSSRHLVLRRWDGAGDANALYDDTNTPGMNLGDGVHVQFGGSDLRTGDYWNFTARSADGSVQALTGAPPAGVTRHRAPLAVVTWGPPPRTSPPSSPPGGVAMQIQDCRKVFPALVNFPQVDKGVHITNLIAIDATNGPPTQLINDTNVQVNTFGGIDIQCDDQIDKTTISRATCYLTADFPIDITNQGLPTAYFPMVLAHGALTVNGTTISWRPLAQTPTLLNQLITANALEGRVLIRVVLKGNFIWSQNDPTSFLDGEAFGAQNRTVNNTGLALPSGDKRRGGDFSMWFWIVAAPSVASSINAIPTQLFVNDVSTVTVTLSAAAPAGSNAVQIASSNPAAAPVPAAAIAVAPGATSVSFQVTGKAVGNANISATFPSVGGQTVAVTLVIQPLPVLTGQLALNPTAIFIGNSSTATVTLSGPTPKTGMVVTLTSSNVAVATVPASVTVAGGSSSATFTVNGIAEGTATITASLSGASLSALITVRKPIKVKDTKEVKDGKEKEVTIDKVQADRISNTKKVGTRELLEAIAVNTFARAAGLGTAKTPEGPALIQGGTGTAAPPAANLRAFIPPEERPPVDNALRPDVV